MFDSRHIDFFNKHRTPLFYYDLELLLKTSDAIMRQAEKYGYHVHYALKANSNPRILQLLQKMDFGADCVSGNEIKRAIECNYNPSKIVFAGVGKTDEEILYGINKNIFTFNCESIQELEVINAIAARENKNAAIALRINPNVNANTHKYITTGLEENKFGINAHEFKAVADKIKTLDHLSLTGLHFHIGSQISELEPFKNLCTRVNEIHHWFKGQGFSFTHLNVGGGLGINYKEPDKYPMPDFEAYFKIFKDFIQLERDQQLHFELGRAIVGQCGTLISKVLFIKQGISTNFAILDAGMTELIRPALYQAYHKIENITNAKTKGTTKKYDVVGPICESSDCFGKAIDLPETNRGDLIALRSAGAYGQVMSSDYNLRDKALVVYSDEI